MVTWLLMAVKWLFFSQVRLCLDRQDYVRAQILSKKIAPKAFVERKGEAKGEIGIEGTAIEAAPEVGGGRGCWLAGRCGTLRRVQLCGARCWPATVWQGAAGRLDVV